MLTYSLGNVLAAEWLVEQKVRDCVTTQATPSIRCCAGSIQYLVKIAGDICTVEYGAWCTVSMSLNVHQRLTMLAESGVG